MSNYVCWRAGAGAGAGARSPGEGGKGGEGGGGGLAKCLSSMFTCCRLTVAFSNLDSHRSFKNVPLRMIPPVSSSLPQSLVLGLAYWEKMLLSATRPQKVYLSLSLYLSISLSIFKYKIIIPNNQLPKKKKKKPP